MSQAQRFLGTLACSALGIVLALLLPDAAVAGYCTDLADCVGGTPGAGRMMLIGTAVIAGVVVVTMGERWPPHLVGGGEQPPAGADDLQKEIDAAKARFEDLQQQLRDETLRQLQAIDKFQSDYDRLWAEAVHGTEDYMRHYPEMMIDLQELWEAVGDREWAKEVAEWVDIGIQAAMMGVDVYHAGAAGLRAAGLLDDAAKAGGAAVRESQVLAGRGATTGAREATAGARSVEGAAGGGRVADEAAAAGRAEREAAAARRAEDAKQQRELSEAMDREHAQYRHERAIEEGRIAQMEAADTQANAERWAGMVEARRDRILKYRADAEAKLKQVIDSGGTPTPEQLRYVEEARMYERMEPINRAHGNLPGNETNCYQVSVELDRQFARELAGGPNAPINTARPAAMDYAGGDFTHNWPHPSTTNPGKDRAFYDVLFPGTQRVRVPAGDAGAQRIAQMLQTPGSRGIVQVEWANGGGGHVFNAVNQNGTVMFVDAQNGTIVTDFSRMAKMAFRQTH